MEPALSVETPDVVRGRIAQVMHGTHLREPPLGVIQLQPHQTVVIERLMGALRELGGALLCDEVGMGKTFVALAVARRFERCLVAAPAALEGMWRAALARTGMSAAFVTYERLSRSNPRDIAVDLLILDEAHHVRNPATRRYDRVARLGRRAAVLMLTATPVHNRRADLVALLSLFLGSRARQLTEAECSRCVVRRESRTAMVSGLPAVMPVVAYDVPDDADVTVQLMTLPPPLPARGAGDAGLLINRGLVHQWASSEAALVDALRRRLAGARALVSSLQAGRYPSARELRAWTLGDGALQLGFPELLSPVTSDADVLLESVSAHANALGIVLGQRRREFLIDEARARCLLRIRSECAGAKIVAFSQYSATAASLYRRLMHFERIAVLTAKGAQVAGGKLSRGEAIRRFAPRANQSRPPGRAEVIDLLVTTDLLSEGVNLQDAEVVVHLDVPWTAARLEQRVGRVARMESSHSHVKVYQIRPPASAERVLRAETLVTDKRELARTLVGVSAVIPFANGDLARSPDRSIASRVERLRAILEGWRCTSVDLTQAADVPVAAVIAGESGFIAAGQVGDTPMLLIGRAGRVTTDLDAQIAICQLAEGSPARATDADYDAALRSIQHWADRNAAAESAGVSVAPPARRRRLLNRLDTILQDAPPHLRASRAPVAARARAIASGSHGAAVERELEALIESPLPDDDWLNVVASTVVRGDSSRAPDGFRLRALLLLKP